MIRPFATWLIRACAVVVVTIAASGAYAEPDDSKRQDAVESGAGVAEREDDGAVSLEPVTVRSPRESRDLSQDRAAAGAVLLPEDFDDAGAALPSVLDQQAGVRVTRLGGPASFSVLSIRGSTSDQVVVVLDGVVLNAASGGPVDFSRIPLANIARIEIYRGAAPLAFGASAIGGVVAITTRSAQARQLAISAGGGSFGERQARLLYTEPQPNWELTLGLDYSGWEGAFTFVNDNGTRFDPSDDRATVRLNNDYNQVNLLAKARLHFADNWSLTVMDWFFWREQGVPGLGQFQSQGSRYGVFDNLSVLTVEGSQLAGMIDLTVQAGFRFVQSAFEDPLNEIGLANGDTNDRSFIPNLNALLDIRPTDWWDIRTQLGYRYETFQPDSRVAVKSARHGLVAGVESGFLIDAADLLLLPSVRVEWNGNRTESAAPATSGDGFSGQTDYAWRMALVNTSIPDTKLSVSGSRAVRMPSLFELFGNSGQVLGNAGLLPESAYNADAGIVYDSTMLPEPYRLRVEAYGFFSDVRNLIQFVQTAQNVSRAENVDRARLWGLEAAIRADLFGHLRLHGNYAYLRAVNTGDLAARNGNDLPLRPASKWYARAEGYITELSALEELALFVDAEWIAGNFLDNANLVSVSDRFFLNAGVNLALAGELATASFTASNLTDERTADLAGYPLPGRGFHFLFTLKVL